MPLNTPLPPLELPHAAGCLLLPAAGAQHQGAPAFLRQWVTRYDAQPATMAEIQALARLTEGLVDCHGDAGTALLLVSYRDGSCVLGAQVEGRWMPYPEPLAAAGTHLRSACASLPGAERARLARTIRLAPPLATRPAHLLSPGHHWPRWGTLRAWDAARQAGQIAPTTIPALLHKAMLAQPKPTHPPRDGYLAWSVSGRTLTPQGPGPITVRLQDYGGFVTQNPAWVARLRATAIRVLSHPDALSQEHTINQTVLGLLGAQSVVPKPLFIGPIDLDHDRFTLHERLQQLRDLPAGVLEEA